MILLLEQFIIFMIVIDEAFGQRAGEGADESMDID